MSLGYALAGGLGIQWRTSRCSLTRIARCAPLSAVSVRFAAKEEITYTEGEAITCQTVFCATESEE